MNSRQTKFIYHKEKTHTNVSVPPKISDVADIKQLKGTVAIVGDSIMLGIREELLKTDKHNVKSKNVFRGGTIEDIEDNIKPILKREPNYIILHVRTNNATNLTARDILDKLLQLKSTVLDARKSCKQWKSSSD